MKGDDLIDTERLILINIYIVVYLVKRYNRLAGNVAWRKKENRERTKLTERKKREGVATQAPSLGYKIN